MDELALVKPDIGYEKQILEYRQASLMADGRMYGMGGLDDRSVREWLLHLDLCEAGEFCPSGYVPSSTWMCVRKADNRLVGMISLRHELNDFLLNYGGNIGYSIHPDHRGKGYSVEQLWLALEKARERGMERVLLTCESWNQASRAVIQNCGGHYEDSRTAPDGRSFERYWITL